MPYGAWPPRPLAQITLAANLALTREDRPVRNHALPDISLAFCRCARGWSPAFSAGASRRCSSRPMRGRCLRPCPSSRQRPWTGLRPRSPLHALPRGRRSAHLLASVSQTSTPLASILEPRPLLESGARRPESAPADPACAGEGLGRAPGWHGPQPPGHDPSWRRGALSSIRLAHLRTVSTALSRK